MGQVLLVRHGQASFGSDDYDVLSQTGRAQAEAVGMHLARVLGPVKPDLVLHGTLRRQRDTALLAAQGAGWDVPIETDARWDEFELLGSAARMATREPDGAALFQRWYEAETERWLAGAQVPGQEPYADFVARVSGALADAAGRGSTVVVVTSGGPVSVVAAELGGGGAAAYARLMPAMVNTSVTKVVTGRRGATLLSWNTHDHLGREQVTYR